LKGTFHKNFQKTQLINPRVLRMGELLLVSNRNQSSIGRKGT